MPGNGLATTMPFFAFETSQEEDQLARLPTLKEVESFVTKIM
jgi:hypothetical protein